MERRLQLQALLEELIGSENVYFQPPATIEMIYPCIVFKRGVSSKTLFANDNPYRHKVGYMVTVIDDNPDSDLLYKIANLPMCSFERHYTSDNLNHDVYNLYY
jgi:hypothetical protein